LSTLGYQDKVRKLYPTREQNLYKCCFVRLFLRICKAVQNCLLIFSTTVILVLTTSNPVRSDVIFVVDAPNSQDTVPGNKSGVQAYPNAVSQTFDLSTDGDSSAFLSGFLEVDSTRYYYETGGLALQFNDDYMGEMNGSGNTATWVAGGYAQGTSVEVYATWRHQSNYSTSAPYRINGGAAININHRNAAAADLVLNDPSGGNESFQLLGTAIADSNGRVQVILNRGNSWTPVDAIAFRSTSSGSLLNSSIQVDYRFDECSYTQLTGDVIDQSGNFDGRSSGIPASINNSIINKSLNLVANSTLDSVFVPNNVINGLDDFSIALWFKTGVTKNQQEIFHALGSDVNDDELEVYLRDDNVVMIKVRDNDHALNSSIVLTNNIWRHLVVTRVGEEVCLFINGVQQDCGNGVNSGVLSVSNANAVVIGQEQDAFGGGFSVSKNFEGHLDELKIFNISLPVEQILNIYQNELAGNNYDGSARNAILCACNEPTLNAVGISIDSGGSDTDITTLAEALDIHAAWLAAGSPATGLIDGGRYNVAASGSSTVDRLDFGGSQGSFTGTLPYPGFGAVGSSGESQFLVRSAGTLYLPAGDYTIYVRSDDGFRLSLKRILGNPVRYSKFGSSSLGTRNVLRFEGVTGNSNTGGSFSLSEDSIFELEAIFFERGAGDYMEIYITNGLTTSTNPSDYEILRHGALDGKVLFGQCTILATPNAHYRFDEYQYNDLENEVIDSISGLNGRARGAQPLEGKVCNAVDLSATGISDYVILDENMLNTKTDFTISLWAKTAKISNQSFISGAYSGNANELIMWFLDHTIFQPFIFSATNTQINTDSIADDTWHHLVWTREGSQNCLYKDKVLQSCNTLNTGALNIQSLILGQEQNSLGGGFNASQAFDGLIDELIAFDEAISPIQISKIYDKQNAGLEYDGSPRTCPPPPLPPINHYQVLHDGQGLTCSAETVTINACTNTYDGTCSLSDLAVALDIRATGSTTVSNSISFTGTTSVNIPYTLAETAVLSLANVSVSAINPDVCVNGSTINCNIIFEDAGFIFLNGSTGSSNTILNQIAGNSFPLRLQAVKNSNGVCEGLFNGNQTIALSQENVDPGGTGGLNFIAGGNDIAKYPGITITMLNFGTDSIATIPSASYFDAGQIRLHADYDIGGISASGSSNAFWVSPSDLLVTAQAGAIALNGATSNALPMHKAGEDFDLTVTAVNSVGNTTPNYTPGQIQFSLARTGPTLSGSVDGAFRYADTSTLNASVSPTFQNVQLSDFVLGESVFGGAQYSEVGLLALDVRDNNYGNANIVIDASTINIGRFVPDHLTQTVAENGLFNATCGFSVAFSAYSGQKDENDSSVGAIRYLTNPVLAITARNKQGDITQNYYEDSQGSINDFMKLSTTNVAAAVGEPLFDQAAVGRDMSNLPLTASLNSGTLSQNDLTALPSIVALPKGVLHYQFSSNDHFFYERSPNAMVAPFRADIDFTMSPFSDTDMVSVISTSDVSPTGVDIRFARLILENSFGPETENLAQVMQIEHFDGSAFTTASDDNCLAYDESKVSLTNISLSTSLTEVLGGTGRFNSGKTQAIELAAPGDGNQGQIGVGYNAYYWLQYDWNNDGNYVDDPSSVATFGIFRGDDRMFHWREVLNE
jgi:MSHA biogenesis protein MshQ